MDPRDFPDYVDWVEIMAGDEMSSWIESHDKTSWIKFRPDLYWINDKLYIWWKLKYR